MTTNTPATVASGGALAALKSLKSNVANVKASVVIAGNDHILKLSQDGGLWTYGQENIEVEEGSRWAINPLSLRHGIVCWRVKVKGDRSPAVLYGKKLVGAGQDKPKPEQCYDADGNAVDHEKHPWVDAIGIDLVCVSGTDKGEKVIYEPTSGGGLKALDAFMDALMKCDDATPVAIVELESGSYPNKSYGGTTYYPDIKIVDWVSMDTAELPAAANEPESEMTQVETPPQTRQRRAAAPANSNSQPEPAEEPASQPGAETAAPTGERRRRRPAA